MPLSQPTDALTMPEVHDRVLDILLQWQAETEDSNRFFYLKRRQDERFKKGYWFPGNEEFLLISFWSGSDNANKSSNVFLEIRRKTGCAAFLTAKDSLIKQITFRQWIGDLDEKGDLRGYIKKGEKPGQWRKPLSHHFGDFEACLRAYLRDDKRTIDRLIRESPEPIGEEHEPPLGFISEPDFFKSLSIVQKLRAQRTIKEAAAPGPSEQPLITAPVPQANARQNKEVAARSPSEQRLFTGPVSRPNARLTMPEVHDRVLDILLQWQAETEDENRFFHLKRKQDDRFKEGCWFPGNDQFLLVSFWSGSDNANKSSNVFLEIRRKTGCAAFLTAKDSTVKQQTFQNWVEPTNDEPILSGYEHQQKGQWRKQLGENFNDFETCLRDYLHSDKRTIDRLIAESPETIGEEYEAPLGFIPEPEFARSLYNVQKLRVHRTIKKNIPFTIRLAQLAIRNFHDLQKIAPLELPPNAPWIFLTGENAAGKTVFLQALALALSDSRTYDIYKVEGSWLRGDVWLNETKSVITRSNPTFDYDFLSFLDGLIGCVVAYGPSRLAALSPDSQNRDIERETAVDSLFDLSGTALKSFDYEFAHNNSYDPDKFEFLKQALIKATAGRIANVTIDNKEGLGEVRYHESLAAEVEADDNSAGAVDTPPKPTSFSKLAVGLKAIVNLVGDIYVRLSDKQGSRRPEELVGIVLIDEIENHLHPKLQRELPTALTAVFPKVQFIASTHSPLPLLGAPTGSVFIRIYRDRNLHITARRLTIDVGNLLPNTILSSPLFGLDNLVAISHKPGEAVRVEDTYQDAASNDAVRERLNQMLSPKNAEQLSKLLNNVKRPE